MTIHRGPESPSTAAVAQYKKQAAEFRHLIELGGMDEGRIPLIISGLYFVDIDLVAIIEGARDAELRDPEPQCGAPIGPRHCVKVWRHTDAHWILED